MLFIPFLFIHEIRKNKGYSTIAVFGNEFLVFELTVGRKLASLPIIINNILKNITRYS